MRIKIYPYKMGSKSAKALAQRLGVKRVYPDKAYHNNGNDLIVNWGASQTPSWPFYNILNKPDAVKIASNKLSTFNILVNDIMTPNFTTSKVEAQVWLEEGKCKRIYCRQLLTSHSGNGIIVVDDPDKMVDALLYVEGITGYRDEFRVHVFNGEVIDVRMKRKKLDTEANQLIRNHLNGYVYCREGIPELGQLPIEAAKFAVKLVGLDFGAVDLIVDREDRNKYWFLEVNTAPGLEGTTLERYAEAIERHYNG